MTSSLTKICTKCSSEFPLNDFRKNKLGKYGRSAECKSCLRKRAKNYVKTRKQEGPSIRRSSKKCPTCSNILPANEFYKNPTTADGLDSRCKECARQGSRRTKQRYQKQGPTIKRSSKKCPCCKKIKPINEYYPVPSAADGHSSWCKECERERRKNLRLRRKIEGPSRKVNVKICPSCRKEKSAQQFSFDSGSSTGLRAYCKSCCRKFVLRRKRNQAYLKRSKKRCPVCSTIKPISEFYKNASAVDGFECYCKDCSNKKSKAYIARNPDTNRARCHAYHSRKKGANGKFTTNQWKKLRNFYAPDGICPCCKRKMKRLSIDHVKPLSKGGENSIANIQPLCRSCNSRKGNRHSADYRFDKGTFAHSLIG